MSAVFDMLRGRMPGTWISHGLACLALSIAGVLVAAGTGGATPTAGGFVGAFLGLAYFLAREQWDKRAHAASVSGYTDTDRLDKTGDTLGPALVFLSWFVALVAERIG